MPQSTQRHTRPRTPAFCTPLLDPVRSASLGGVCSVGRSLRRPVRSSSLPFPSGGVCIWCPSYQPLTPALYHWFCILRRTTVLATTPRRLAGCVSYTCVAASFSAFLPTPMMASAPGCQSICWWSAAAVALLRAGHVRACDTNGSCVLLRVCPVFETTHGDACSRTHPVTG